MDDSSSVILSLYLCQFTCYIEIESNRSEMGETRNEDFWQLVQWIAIAFPASKRRRCVVGPLRLNRS